MKAKQGIFVLMIAAVVSCKKTTPVAKENDKQVSETTMQAAAQPASAVVLRSEYESIGDFIYNVNDSQEGSVTYSIIAGNAQQFYAINAATGTIRINKIIPDAIGIATRHTITVKAGTRNYEINIVDGLDHTIQRFSGRYFVLNDHNETFVDPSTRWTAVNNLWGRGTAVPNVDFRIVTLRKASLPDSTIFLWDVPGMAAEYNGSSIWSYANVFWGNRKGVRENLADFPFKIANLNTLKLNFEFEQLYGNQEYKVALNTFLTDEPFLTNFSENDGDFFFVFDQKGTYIPPYPVSLPDTVIEGKTFVRRYQREPSGYELRRVIIKNGDRYLSGSLDLKKVFGGFISRGYMKPKQSIYHLQFGLEITTGFGGLRLNNADIIKN